jgi:hypothetical protein
MQNDKKPDDKALPKSNFIEHSVFQDLLKNPIAKIFAVITGFAAIFGIGYSVGIYKESFDAKMEKIEFKQDCNERVQKATEDCREAKLLEYGKSVDDLKTVVSELKRKADEK